jgi:hypothetical protein
MVKRRCSQTPEDLRASTRSLTEAQRGGAVRKPANTVAGIATRYEKRASNYRAIVVIAALMIWLTS